MYICIQYEYNMYIQYNYFISENLRTPLMYLSLPFLPPQTPQLKKTLQNPLLFPDILSVPFSLELCMDSPPLWQNYYFHKPGAELPGLSARLRSSSENSISCTSTGLRKVPSSPTRVPPQETVGGNW